MSPGSGHSGSEADPDSDSDATTADRPARVVAQGTFDLLPGHVHYLGEAAAMGEELHVIVARRTNVTHKDRPVLSDEQRRKMVGALDPVDVAHVGHHEDFVVPIERIDADLIVLGHDQYHDEEDVRRLLADRGIDCDVARASARPREDEEELLSTGRIVDRVCEERC
jgi:FAD synthetase